MAPRQDRVELKGSARAAFPSGQDVGPADPNQQIEVSVLLRRGSKPGDFPAADQMGSRLPRDRRTIKLSGTVQAFNDAFGANLRRYAHASGSYRCRTGALTIPADLDGIIEGVLGLDNRPQAKPHFRLRKKNSSAQPNATDVSYSPLQVAKAYAFPSGATGSGQCIALIELGGGYNASDLTQFFGNLGISTPKVTAVSVDGATNSPTGDASGPDAEGELDIEVAGSIAPAAQIPVYFAPHPDQGFIDAITTAVHDAKLNPSIISISWGGPEDSWTAQSRNALNSACQDASTMGVTVLAASGDNGSARGRTTGKTHVDFPASSPFLVGCGGTKLALSGTSISSEQTWNELSANEGATGGGVSQAFALPSFQQSANVPKAL